LDTSESHIFVLFDSSKVYKRIEINHNDLFFKIKSIDNQNCRFAELIEDEQNILREIGKRMVAIRSRYFQLVFEGIFSDVPFLKSPRHKVQILLQQKT